MQTYSIDTVRIVADELVVTPAAFKLLCRKLERDNANLEPDLVSRNLTKMTFHGMPVRMSEQGFLDPQRHASQKLSELLYRESEKEDAST